MGGSESEATSEQNIENKTRIAVENTVKHIQNCGGRVINDSSQMVIQSGSNNSIIDMVLAQNNIYDQPNLLKCVQQTQTELEDNISAEQEAAQAATQTPTATTSTAIPILGAVGAQMGGAGGLIGGSAIFLIVIGLIIYYLFFSSSE